MIVIFDIVESGIYMPMLRDVHDLHDLLRFFLIATSWTLIQDLQHHRERDAELLQQARQRQIFWFDLLIPIRFHHFHYLLHLRLYSLLLSLQLFWTDLAIKPQPTYRGPQLWYCLEDCRGAEVGQGSMFPDAIINLLYINLFDRCFELKTVAMLTVAWTEARYRLG